MKEYTITIKPKPIKLLPVYHGVNLPCYKRDIPTHTWEMVYTLTIGVLSWKDPSNYKDVVIHLYDAFLRGECTPLQVIDAMKHNNETGGFPPWVYNLRSSTENLIKIL